ncbi:tol-pal system-associated acyl-CoA thioesterase [Litoreibacter sp.]|nr:tol-pal system-associated acyl-CoA thioesterase [Litoreibacter sp.]
MSHKFTVRIYYEDTDLAGIVYYANYLKFIERARSEWVRELGVDQVAMKADGLVFAVRRVEADYLAPARFDDLIRVQTSVARLTGSRIVLTQDVMRDTELLFGSIVTLVCLAETGKPARIPADIRAKMQPHT